MVFCGGGGIVPGWLFLMFFRLFVGIGNAGNSRFGTGSPGQSAGAGDIIKPAAPNLVMLGPAFLYFASWSILGLIGFWVFGYEPKGPHLR